MAWGLSYFDQFILRLDELRVKKTLHKPFSGM